MLKKILLTTKFSSVCVNLNLDADGEKLTATS